MEKVTLKKLADLAGVSPMTVSNVISNKESKVSQKTRERVQALIEEYDFVPNQNASNLRSKSSKLLGILFYYDKEIYDVDFSDPFISSVLTGIEEAALEAGYFTMTGRFNSVEEISVLQRNWIFAGFIIISASSPTLPSIDAAIEVPVTYIDAGFGKDNIPSKSLRNFVGTDDEEVSEKIAKYLLEKGHEKVLFFSYDFEPNTPSVMQQRYQGFVKYFPDAVLRTVATSDYQGILQAVSEFLTEQPFTAIYATADILAAQLNLIFKDVSLIGVDDANFTSFISPKLSTIRIDQIEKGRLAVHYLIDSIQSGTSKVYYSSCELVDRDSVKDLKR